MELDAIDLRIFVLNHRDHLLEPVAPDTSENMFRHYSRPGGHIVAWPAMCLARSCVVCYASIARLTQWRNANTFTPAAARYFLFTCVSFLGSTSAKTKHNRS